MLFNSWTFFLFLIATFVMYHWAPWPWATRGFWQITLLTVASYVFYAWHTPWLVLILAASTAINAYTSLRLLRPSASKRSRQRWMLFAVASNLGVLAFFKYASLLVQSFLPESWWAQWGFNLAEIPLPVGISFFTFQGISLVIDLYRAGPNGLTGISPPKSVRESGELMVRMAFFKAFFPQLVAGPIVKAHEFMYQISGKFFARIPWDLAIRNLILGYFLKMVVADNLKEATAALSYPAFVGLPGLNLLILLYGYSLQIFADFAGYSLIAMGLARLFGYQLPINFNFPYLARSITEFWRRWHISLSTWLKEYLYIPLGGNRHGAARTYANLIIVMLLGGLWHGAAWSYMIWGGAHGLFLALERLFGNRGQTQKPDGSIVAWMVGALQMVLTFHLVSLLWLLFQLPRFEEVILYFRELFSWKPGLIPQPAYVVLVFGSPVLFYHLWGLWSSHRRARYADSAQSSISWFRDLAYAVMLFLILTNSGSPGEFIYFQF